ncbi:MAG: penicillin acylase family protein [Sandaracinus sp.]|nr:penicillin acylase family protein [Sandaracinus sp.]MCB9614634.1 penicillin acylase family protein [Sandaracinus sp.]MCB9631112.1 penicillin acylase family protein [Sandaracinus sp.]
MSKGYRVLASLATLLFLACGDDDGPRVDASVDAEVDAGLPEGPRGDVLRIPETERWNLPTLQGEVYVVRTEANVPHVYASNERDLRVVQGFLLARDRYFQIEAGRRLAQGRLSELLGDAALASDQQSRAQGMRRVAERLATLLTDEQRETYTAYVEGVNAYIAMVQDRAIDAPSELAAAAPFFGTRNPGTLMEPLTVEDLVAFAAVPVWQLGWESQDLDNAAASAALDAWVAPEGAPQAELRRDGAIQIYNQFEPINDVSSAAGFGLEGATTALRPTPRILPPRLFPRTEALRVERDTFDRLRDRTHRFSRVQLGNRGEDFGSNSWATMGDRASDGAAILSGDGHLPLSIAPLFYQLGLDTSVFGDGASEPTTLMGLFFAGIPPMAVGTNGRIAWSQTYLRGDVTDWYGEEIVLEGGVPTATVVDGSNMAIRRVSESYVVKDVPALDSVGRTETWDRYETFDGRAIVAIEGTPAMADTPGAINVSGEYVVPGDVDGSGSVTGISFDFAAFDVSNVLTALQGFNDSDTVSDFRASTRRLVTYAQNLVAADIEGDVYYGSYNAIPTREYLPRDETTRVFEDGADPRKLLDGTRFRGFTIPLDADGFPDESQCAGDEYQCLVPFEQWPAALSPARGFVLTANNDVGNITTDGDFYDDPYYLGGPWNNGFRGNSIRTKLEELTTTRDVTPESMSQLQATHDSVLGRLFAPRLLDAIARAKALSEGTPSGEDETRLAALYAANAASFDDVVTRLQAWLDGGAPAESGVETFYHSPTAAQRQHAVATMIFNEWHKAQFRWIFDDEAIDDAFDTDRATRITRALYDLWRGRGAGNPADLTHWDSATEESVYFDRVGTTEVERSDEIALLALADAIERLEAAPDPETPGIGGFGTTDRDQWLWGLRHLVVFESILNGFIPSDDPALSLLVAGFSITPDRIPLMAGLADTDPRASLPWFPRPGDLFNVDAAHYGIERPDYWFSDGPVMRMVIRLKEGEVGGVNVLPGGQSGLTSSPHFDDQVRLWLANDTVPLRFRVEDVVAGAVGREVYHP